MYFYLRDLLTLEILLLVLVTEVGVVVVPSSDVGITLAIGLSFRLTSAALDGVLGPVTIFIQNIKKQIVQNHTELS